MVTFLMFARPLLLRLAGAEVRPPQAYRVAADFALRKKPGRREWLRGHLSPGPDGTLRACRFPNEGSGIFTSIVASTGLIACPRISLASSRAIRSSSFPSPKCWGDPGAGAALAAHDFGIILEAF